MHTKVSEVLKTKGSEIWSVHPDATVFEGLAFMAEKNIGALIVMENGELAGIFSERDYARKVILKGKSSKETPIRELMTTKLFTVKPSDSMQNCMQLMTDKHIRHLPVLHETRVLGVLSIGDVVKRVIADLQYTVTDLENYITNGSYTA
ncbi:MAG: CBS domain-containing protein [Chloroflexota bacterium]